MQERQAWRACKRLLKRRVESAKFPSSASHGSMRVRFRDGGSAIVSLRSTARAELEFEVLRRLRAHGAIVPDVLAYDGRYLIQEDLGKNQFSRVIKTLDESEFETQVNTALTSLLGTQNAAKEAGLKRFVATLGEGDQWRRELTNRPRLLGEFLNIPVPDLPIDKVVERLRVVDFDFVKWDARPPNAIQFSDGNVGWIDWEHCGRRNCLDDLVWFFGDQSTPDWPEVEDRLLDHFVPAFSEGWDIEDARDYLAVYGTLHMCLRLSFTLNSQKKRGLKDWSSVNTGDKTAKSALKGARRTSIRASRWAARSPLTASLSPWLQEVSQQMIVPDQAESPNHDEIGVTV